jgi:hypothetical protein
LKTLRLYKLSCRLPTSAAKKMGVQRHYWRTIALFASALCGLAQARGATLPTSIQDVSSEFNVGATDRRAIHTVDGSGLDANNPPEPIMDSLVYLRSDSSARRCRSRQPGRCSRLAAPAFWLLAAKRRNR